MAALLLGSVAPLGAQDLEPLGDEFRVNTNIDSTQNYPSSSSEANGDFVVVWQSYDIVNGSTFDIFLQRYTSSGTALGGELQVNTFTTSRQAYASVSSDADGDFVVVWQSGGADGDTYGISAQRYASSGAALGAELQVNTFTTSQQVFPSVSSEANGDFVVVWRSDGQDGDAGGIFVQRYASGGAAVGGELRVNTSITSGQFSPVVSSDAEGNFVVVWTSDGQDGAGFGIFAQRHASSGAALGEEFRVNTFTTSRQAYPSASSDTDGDFVVVWQSFSQDGDEYGIFGQRYASSGAAQGEELRVSSFTTARQGYSSVSSAADGDFVVVWQSVGQDGSFSGIFAQRYTSSGAARGGELQVNTHTFSAQDQASVSSDPAGNLVVAWTSEGQDTYGDGVYAQRFGSGEATPTSTVTVTVTVTPTSTRTASPTATATSPRTATSTPTATAASTSTPRALPSSPGESRGLLGLLLVATALLGRAARRRRGQAGSGHF